MLKIVIFGCIGGLLPDILRLIKSRYRNRLPKYVKNLNFLLGVILLAGIGGMAAWILGAQGPKEALAYGFAAPELFSKLVAQRVKEVERGEVIFKLREWWAS